MFTPITASPLRQAGVYTTIAFTAETAIGLIFRGSASPAAPMLSILVPVLSVVAVTFGFTPRGRRREIWSGVGLRRAAFRFWPIAIAVPVAVVAVPYALAWAVGLVTFHDLAPSLPDLAFSGVLFTGIILGEEIGWRGFLLPRLREVTSGRRAALITGFLHGLFHVPLLTLTASYDSAGNRWVVVPVVVVTITAAGVFYAWLRERSDSIWPVAITHNMVNSVLDLATSTAATTSPVAVSYVAGESGLATFAAVALVAAVVLRRTEACPALTRPDIPFPTQSPYLDYPAL